MKMIILQSRSEARRFSRILVSSILILADCCRCNNVSDVNVDDSVDPDVRPRSAKSPTSLSSINCTSQDSRGTKPGPTAGVLTQSESTTRYVAVFSTNWVLCSDLSPFHRHGDRFFAMNRTECPHIWAMWEGEPYLYVFLPHLKILFNYLLEHGVRIAFFPINYHGRYPVVIRELLRSFWGSEEYKALKFKGQFRIYGNDDMRVGKYNNVKDLQLIIRDGESASNAVLVEESRHFCADDQKPAILVASFGAFRSYNDEEDFNPLNNVYYLLGVFKTYFENEKYETLPLREAMSKIIPTTHSDSCCAPRDYIRAYPPFVHYFHKRHPFVQEMVDVGFAAVREVVPHATLYNI